ncbi:uncharacterized protein LOC126370794 [Pectinophora gossypiella]|uniref:uncharacterized protein LOC126370794 n=1 Tax=Pectinophora gossypiella TaxID=13191 RepID=UPI00214E6FFC|nr:uncharacterized protein LOC126370794 [Pectinophora gossypiella]
MEFNAGIGTPSPADMINVNWAFQANFQLPWNRSQIPFDLLEANSGYDGLSRRKRDADVDVEEMKRDGDYQNDAKLCHFYKYVEEVLNSFGQNGTSCVLQTLCRLGAEPLHSDDEEDLLHELASYVLNPTNDISLGMTEKDEHYKYIEAYKRGEKGLNCFNLYSDCTTSLVDMFTKLHENS